MNKLEYKRVFNVAKNHEYITSKSLEENTWKIFDGIAYNQNRQFATIENCAYALNYHCLCLNGDYDMDAVNEFFEYCKKIDLLN
jgi:hypothetical protein